MIKQDCKFTPGTLVFESHEQEMSVYLALGCRKYFHYVGDVQVTRECQSGTEFFFYFGTMNQWGHDKNNEIREGNLVCSLPSVSVRPWDTRMVERYSGSLGLKSFDSSYTKWAWRVALWRRWDSSIGSLVHLSPICKTTLGDTEFSMLVDKLTAHFWRRPN